MSFTDPARDVIARLDAINRTRSLTKDESRHLEKAFDALERRERDRTTGPARAAPSTFPFLDHLTQAEVRR